MVEVSSFFADNARAQVWRAGPCNDQASCVLYWMQRAQRGKKNHALNAAIALANELRLPVITAFVVTHYPGANLRHYTFMLEGLAGTAKDLSVRGVPFIIRCSEPATEIHSLSHELHATAVISDVCELRTPRQWREELRQRLAIPFICVDSDTVVPIALIPQEEYAARTIRPKIHRLLPTFLSPVVDIEVTFPLRQPPSDPGEIKQPLRYLEALRIDRSIPAVPDTHGGYAEGQKRVTHFLENRLPVYAKHRNDPEHTGTSEVSAYLHFGHISVQQLAWDVAHHQVEETKYSEYDVSEGKAAYLEEVIVRRELAINFAYYNAHYDSLEGCPLWGRKTLQKHANDLRDPLYSLETLEQAHTHDKLWNAAQREMVTTGRMHGYMRMYWGKKILEWSATPEDALHRAVYLNDKYELDGRDANGYANICWCIGGKHDRPWKERPIFGTIRYLSADGVSRKFDTQAYINKYSE